VLSIPTQQKNAYYPIHSIQLATAGAENRIRRILPDPNHRMKIQCCVLGARKNIPDFLEFQLLNGYTIVLGRGQKKALEGWEFQSSNRRAEVGAQVDSGYCLHL
jgi:hypothetical protein